MTCISPCNDVVIIGGMVCTEIVNFKIELYPPPIKFLSCSRIDRPHFRQIEKKSKRKNYK